VATGQLTNSIAHGWAPIGAHQVNLDLAAGETRQIVFVLGYQENPVDRKVRSARIRKSSIRKGPSRSSRNTSGQRGGRGFDRLHAHWDKLLGIFQVDTPDIHTNRMVNIWNAYQCMATFNMSRSASFYRIGIGRGLGFRDSNQDLLGFVHMVPARARERILDLAATQLPDRRRLSPVPAADEARQQRYWGRIQRRSALAHPRRGGLSEGDRRLEHSRRGGAPYDNKPGTEEPLYEHLHRSFRYTLDRLGQHGLPLIGRADWNDCLNLNCFSDTPGNSFQTTTNRDGKVAESVFIAGLFVHASHELAAIASRHGHAGRRVLFPDCGRQNGADVKRARVGR
jgi:cellobiose phosphorylase